MARHSDLNRRHNWLYWPTLLVLLVAVALIMVLWVPIEQWNIRGKVGAPATAPVTQSTPESDPAESSGNTAAPPPAAPSTTAPATSQPAPAPATSVPTQQ